MKTDVGENVECDGSSPGDSLPDELQRLYDKAFALSDRDARVAKTMADEIYAKAGDAKSPYWQGLSRYLAGFCLYNLSEYDSAMEEFEHGDQIAQEYNLPNLAIKFRNGYGAIFSRLGRYHDAIEQFAEGLKKAREIGLKSDIGHFLVNLGEASLLMGDAAQALSFESEAEGLIPELAGESRYAIDVYYNLAEAQSRSGRIEDAERSYRRSLETATMVGNTVSEVEARVRLGSILADRGHEAEVLSVIEEALRLSRSCGFPLQEVGSLLARGRIELNLGRLEEAIRHYEMAVEIADSHRMGDLLPSALESLSTAKAAMNRFDEAYHDLLKSVEAAHAWSSSEAARMLAELATGYRLEKVKREAEGEKIRREGLESANERLRIVTRIGRSLTQSLEPRDILMRMWNELSASIDLKSLGFGIYSPDSGEIEFPGLIESGVLQKASSVFLSDESSLAALCVREKRVLYYATSDDARSAIGDKPTITFGSAPVRSETILYLPLFRENDIVGVMTVQSARDHAYSDDIIEMLEAIASFTAIAVENARIMIRLNEMNQTISGEKEQVEKAALASSWLAEHDSLTGLSNRRFLERVLDENIRLATLEDNNIALFFADLDDFKKVNDVYGHDAGDRVLVAVAARLLSVFRDADYVARVGGDEFVVAAPGVKDVRSIASMADKVVASLNEPLTITEGPISVSISVGVALFPEHGRSSQELIKRADDAMYLIKRTGKGAWRLWSAF
ncbi:diguanylate cyclase domain-containing protein [Candidatus Cryosericum septentrionale]|jgi:diguanylate cyclase (GGDEF)-like protein|uniref:Diguanylate cyclase n=1 Tax=Candidatus Cryosericum septentrionale TaxID=2290913 RepID=A0A398E1H8_9BACT|nr:diguanylate cyclase [Candidatus Cryosericum septentrionale]RIE16491.1 diguanylate cyclase [Candidatus Cryosericum septentrionale]